MSNMHRLGNLLLAPSASGIAAALRADVLRASGWLRQQPAGPTALYLADARLFAIWLLACWQAGRCVILPGDATAATERLLLEGGALLLGDFSQAAIRNVPPEIHKAPLARSIRDAQAAVEVFTSGSTGTPTRIGKTLRQLDAEVQALETVFGATLPADQTLLTTVSHQHLYGLLFCILWPLARGQQALAKPATYPEELLACRDDYTLISSPAFLKRLPQELAWPRPSRCLKVFSSGGALPANAAIHARACLGAGITEIYGSSETGGIARRSHPAESWLCQPGVETRLLENGCLAVRSAFLPDDTWFETADRARLTETGFALEGRNDRIVKIEEKRISLTALENSLQSQRWISEARVIPLHGQRTLLAAVATLSAAGQAALASHGKLALSQQLRTALADEFERIALPRRWRFVTQLPVNSMGKTTETALAELFTDKPRLPRLIRQENTDSGITLQLELQADLVVFDGHFPGLPILPGVAQLEWAVHFGHTLLGTPNEFQGMDAIKFQKIMQPGEQIELTLNYLPAKQQLQFCYQSAAGIHASGRIRLGEKPA